jgi:predicted acyltransferase
MTETTLPRDPRTPAPQSVPIPAVAPPASPRLLSLDVFRGITIAGMLLVNDPGSWSHIYPPLEHSEWNGWTPTDLVFPFFLFIVGVAMTFSFGKLLSRGAGRGELLAKAGKRAAILFLLGLSIAAFPWWQLDLSTLRIPGVLQRIAIAYLVATPLLLWLGRRGRILATLALLLGSWAVMRFVPVPGVGAGIWEPGRDIGSYLDRLIFGTAHLWSSSRTWDPEGLLSTLPSVATVLLGAFAGDWLRSARSRERKVLGLAASGVALAVIGLLWDLSFPINKNLWTSSFVLFTGGLALLGLAACYWLVDVKGRRRWSMPFVVLGANAIAAYWLAEIVAIVLGLIPVGDASLQDWLYGNAFASWLSPLNASLAFAVCYVAVFMALMGGMYRRGIFLKV